MSPSVGVSSRRELFAPRSRLEAPTESETLRINPKLRDNRVVTVTLRGARSARVGRRERRRAREHLVGVVLRGRPQLERALAVRWLEGPELRERAGAPVVRVAPDPAVPSRLHRARTHPRARAPPSCERATPPSSPRSPTSGIEGRGEQHSTTRVQSGLKSRTRRSSARAPSTRHRRRAVASRATRPARSACALIRTGAETRPAPGRTETPAWRSRVGVAAGVPRRSRWGSSPPT